MITLKSKREIELLAIAGNIVYQTHKYLQPYIKEGIKTIEDESFEYCDSLKTLILPPNLEIIGGGAFLCFL